MSCLDVHKSIISSYGTIQILGVYKMINFILSSIVWSICMSVVSVATLIGVMLYWATKFDDHIRQQTKERDDSN